LGNLAPKKRTSPPKIPESLKWAVGGRLRKNDFGARARARPALKGGRW